MSSLNRVVVKKIKRLDQTVVNRISAGEVIHRPINVVKELIENCLDANSNRIEVSVRDGGIKSIVIQDNGSGIEREDLDLVCERFTTSKLQSLEDLLQIQSYGFRGEALASISHISYVMIVTKTAEQVSGFKQQYIDGKPIGKAVPMAANNGTIITVENLFYNLLMRKNALTSHSYEYNLILDLMTKYAIHYSQRVSFSLKKSAENCDLNTNIENTIKENIRRIYGSNIANNLIEITFEDQNLLNFSMNGLITNQNIHQKNYWFILFINDRLVECQPLKKAINLIYDNFLMKGFHPFIYLNIKIDSKNVDVNIHPTKSEVHFLHEQNICEQIVNLIESKLTNGPTHRLNPEQSLMNLSFFQNETKSDDNSQQKQFTDIRQKERQTTPQRQTTLQRLTTPQRPHNQIRTDSKDRKIEEFLSKTKQNVKNRREIKYESVLSLRKSVREETDSSLQDMICRSSYVGCVDETSILLQFETQLLLVNAWNLNRELFYQLFLIDFGNFSSIQFSKPLLIEDLVKQYLEVKARHQDIDSETKQVIEVLFENREMISDYFAIDFSDNKELIRLPLLLNGFVPNFGYLGQFLYELAKHVIWTNEIECFQSIGRILSEFYAKPPKFESDSEHQKWAKIMESIVYPTYKAILCPPKILSQNSTFFVTTNLSDLYKVFERC